MDLIEEFVRRTDNGLSPERYRRWTALAMVAAVVDRRVYTAIRAGKQLFPNLYILLVGPPGEGKTMAIEAGRALAETQPHVALAPDHTSYEAFIRQLSKRAEELDAEEEMPKRRATLALMLSEWGTFIRTPELDQLAMLAHVYDCGDYKALTIGRGLDFAENLYVNILAGCTPAWFAEGFPPNSYEQGLPTRLVLVYEESVGPLDTTPPYVSDMTRDPIEEANKLTEFFWPHLDRLAKVRGFVPWDEKAIAGLNSWKAQGYAPRPDDPMLVGYCKRRPLNVAKIALLFALARHPDVAKIFLPDFESAKEILLDAEIAMPKALTAAGGNIYQLRMEAVAIYVEKRYLETKKPVPEWEVRQKLGRMVPPQLLRPIVDEMVNQNRIRAWEGTKAPNRKLTPGVTR